MFAHRGGSALARENTIAAFDNGLALGADGLELDVHLSRDGVVVVHHDRMLERTTALRGPIAQQRADDLRRADVPTLAEVLSRYRDPRVIIEMKVNSPELAAATVAAIRRADAVDRVCLGSFGLRVLRAARALEPAIATSGGARGSALGAVPFVVPLAGVAGRLRRISDSGALGQDAGRVAALCRIRAQRRAGRAGVDGRHARGGAAFDGMGR